MDAIVAKIQEAEIMLATIKADLMKADLKFKIFSKSETFANATSTAASPADSSLESAPARPSAEPPNINNDILKKIFDANVAKDFVALGKESSYHKKVSKRYDPDTFVDEIYEIAKDRTFKDGKTKKALCGLPRTCWPLRADGEPYEKLQHLCRYYNLACIRDDPEKPTVFIVFD